MSRVRLNNLYLNAGALDFHRARQYSGSIDAAERCRAYLDSMLAADSGSASAAAAGAPPPSRSSRRCFMVGYVVQWPPRWRVAEEMRRRLGAEAAVDTDEADDWQSVRAQHDYDWRGETPAPTTSEKLVQKAEAASAGEDEATPDVELSAGLVAMSLEQVQQADRSPAVQMPAL